MGCSTLRTIQVSALLNSASCLGGFKCREVQSGGNETARIRSGVHFWSFSVYIYIRSHNMCSLLPGNLALSYLVMYYPSSYSSTCTLYKRSIGYCVHLCTSLQPLISQVNVVHTIRGHGLQENCNNAYTFSSTCTFSTYCRCDDVSVQCV